MMQKALGLPLLAAALLPTLPAQMGLKLTNGGSSNPHVAVKYDASLVPQTGLTVEAWITYDDANLGTGTRRPTILWHRPAVGAETYYLRVDAGTTRARVLEFGVQSSNGLVRRSYTFQPGEFKNWTHVAGTWDGSSMRLFVNGFQKAAGTFRPGTLVNGGGDLRIGCGASTATASEVWNGEIDEVRLWPFARTQAEIQSTMRLHLVTVPGEVSTWNLDFTGADSSGNNQGVTVDKPTFAMNTLQLTTVAASGGASFGSGTAGCQGVPAAGISSHAHVGNAAFALTCVRTAGSGNTLGFLWLGLGRLQAPVPLDTAAMWIDPSRPGLLIPVSHDSQRFSRLAIAIPKDRALIGAQVHNQYFWNESTCPVAIFASQGLTLTIQP